MSLHVGGFLVSPRAVTKSMMLSVTAHKTPTSQMKRSYVKNLLNLWWKYLLSQTHGYYQSPPGLILQRVNLYSAYSKAKRKPYQTGL